MKTDEDKIKTTQEKLEAVQGWLQETKKRLVKAGIGTGRIDPPNTNAYLCIETMHISMYTKDFGIRFAVFDDGDTRFETSISKNINLEDEVEKAYSAMESLKPAVEAKINELRSMSLNEIDAEIARLQEQKEKLEAAQ